MGRYNSEVAAKLEQAQALHKEDEPFNLIGEVMAIQAALEMLEADGIPRELHKPLVALQDRLAHEVFKKAGLGSAAKSPMGEEGFNKILLAVAMRGGAGKIDGYPSIRAVALAIQHKSGRRWTAQHLVKYLENLEAGRHAYLYLSYFNTMLEGFRKDPRPAKEKADEIIRRKFP